MFMKNKAAVNVARIALAAMALTASVAMPAQAASDKLTVVVTDEPKSLDPCDTDLSGNSRILRNNVTETLVNLSPVDGAVTPSLATGWKQLDDLNWEFKLREGVTFHDGKPFDASAVVAALTRAQDPALACEVGLATLKGVTFTAKESGPSTVVIHTDIVEPILPNKMASLDIGSPSTPTDAKTRDPVGTGPYKLAAWAPGQSITLSTYDGYWGDKPAIKDATIIWRAESAVRAAMVETGEAQIAYEIAPQDGASEQDHAFPNAETSLLRIDLP
jgi:peptide/nickel transport system substrate-binding protein